METSLPADPAVARLFVGLWPDERVREALLACAEGWEWARGARRVPRNKLHMTLHFLGAVPHEQVPRLAQALPFEAFELCLDHAEVWPNEVAVLRPHAPPPALADLHQRLQLALDEAGQGAARERWLPHVTLARRAKGTLLPVAAPSIRWAVEGFALIDSMPSSAYRVLSMYR